MTLSRRRFMRNMLAAPAVGSVALNPFLSTIAHAEGTANALGKTLVVIFQRGANDGVNTVVPYGDAEYYAVRGGSIAVPPPGEASRSALDLDGFFGLHPSMSAMHDIYHAGDMAVMPTVSWQDTSRSHFENQAAIESGGKFLSSQGWLNQHLQTQARDVPLRAVSFGGLSQSMRGDYTVSALNSLTETGLGESNNQGLQNFLDIDMVDNMRVSYGLSEAGSGGVARDLVYKHGRQLIEDIDVLSDADSAAYQVENGAVYSASTLSKNLKDAAQLIKADMGVEVVSISVGGWDTHLNQGGAEEVGAHTTKLADFSDSIGAFYTDLGDKMDDVLILTMSEFGRSLKVNASGGTDHGHAAAWFVIGRSVSSSVYGEWPGLLPAQLDHGRYLNDTIDFRDIMGEVLSLHLQNTDIGRMLPGFSNYNPLGFLA